MTILDDPPAHRLLVIPWLRRLGHYLLLPNWLAITIDSLIISWRTMDAAELAHELAHVRQWQRYGVLFIPRYLRASLRARLGGGHRYTDNVYEVEARAAAEAVRRSLEGPA